MRGNQDFCTACPSAKYLCKHDPIKFDPDKTEGTVFACQMLLDDTDAATQACVLAALLGAYMGGVRPDLRDGVLGVILTTGEQVLEESPRNAEWTREKAEAAGP